MRSAKGDGELTKILVERHQHPSLFIARVGGSPRRRDPRPNRQPTLYRDQPGKGLPWPSPRHRCRERLSRAGLALEGLDALVADDPLCVHETGLDIFRLEPGVTFEMVSTVSPAASMPRTCSTASLRPRTIGFPPKISGLIVIRVSSFCSSTMATFHCAPI